MPVIGPSRACANHQFTGGFDFEKIALHFSGERTYPAPAIRGWAKEGVFLCISGRQSKTPFRATAYRKKLFFTFFADAVKAEATSGPYSKVGLGIVKFHFEAAADNENFSWE